MRAAQTGRPGRAIGSDGMMRPKRRVEFVDGRIGGDPDGPYKALSGAWRPAASGMAAARSTTARGGGNWRRTGTCEYLVARAAGVGGGCGERLAAAAAGARSPRQVAPAPGAACRRPPFFLAPCAGRGRGLWPPCGGPAHDTSCTRMLVLPFATGETGHASPRRPAATAPPSRDRSPANLLRAPFL